MATDKNTIDLGEEALSERIQSLEKRLGKIESILRIEEWTEDLDEDEAFATQAIEYLAINDADMVLLFE